MKSVLYRLWIWPLLLFICFSGYPSFAAWTTVGNGIEYQKFTLPDPNNVFVSRMLRSNTNTSLETSIAKGHISGDFEVVSSQASRYDEAINYWDGSWGKRNDVVVAINGDRFAWATGVISGGQVYSGWYIDRFPNMGGRSAFGWKFDRSAFIGDCLTNRAANQIITYIGRSTTQRINDVNVARGTDQLIVYTPQYNSTTMTDDAVGSVEVLVEMTQPAMLLRSPSMSRGYVRQIRINQGSTPLPFDHIVISATGTAAVTLLANVSVGSEIGISQDITTYEHGCSVLDPTVDWQGTCASVAGTWTLLRNGVIVENTDSEIIIRDPRTAIAYNDTYIFFVICDGRTTASVGMTGEELAVFCKNTLGATWAINIDGGGSSTMVVNGVVKNNPSGGSQRAVSNGIMMVNLLPKVQTTIYNAQQPVKTSSNANLRLGPGTNYDILSTIGNNTQGTVVSHSLNGVLAKAYNWWKVDFNGTVGWVAQSNLTAVQTAPIITVQPQSQEVCFNSNASLTVSAVGPGTISYQWRKNGINLTNSMRYSGVTTPALIITGVTTSDAASYTCAVSNTYGTNISQAAVLTVNQPPATPSDGTPVANGSGSITWKWNDVSGETGYRVKDANGVLKSPDLAANTIIWTETTGISANTQYTRKIYAFNGCGESSSSAGQSKYSLQITPTAPTYSSVGTNSMKVSTTSPVNLASGSSGVIFFRNETPFDKIQALSFTDTGLTPNTRYTYRVKGVNADGVETQLSNSTGRYTLAKAGEDLDGTGANGNVWCSNAVKNTLYGPGKTFTFVNPLGFRTGTHGGDEWAVSSFYYKWNKNPNEPWQSIGPLWSSGSLDLSPADGDGSYYLHLIARNGDSTPNLNSKLSYGPFNYDSTLQEVDSISHAWQLQDQQRFSLKNKPVTAAFEGFFFLEELNRTAAIKVVSAAQVALGNTVSVTGVLGLSGTQRAMFGDVIENLGGSSLEPAAVGMLQKDIGGSDFNPMTPGITGGKSLYNVGLLIRCWGQITHCDTTNPTDQSFYIDDGSGLFDGLHKGIKIRCGSIAPPVTGMAIITGVITTENVDGRTVPVILIRQASDIVRL